MTIKLVEERAKRSSRAKDWTPEMVLEELLDDIRAGRVKAERLLVIIGEISDDNTTGIRLRVGGPRNPFESLGMLTQAQWALLDPDA